MASSFVPELYQNQPVDDWRSGEQPLPYPDSRHYANIAVAGLGLGALTLFGYTKIGDQRGWDYYLKAIRAVEEYSPGKILRTFQLSHMLSPLETASQQFRYFSPEILQGLSSSDNYLGRGWLDYLTKLTGADFTSPELLNEGFRFENGKLYLGRTGDKVLLEHASVLRNPLSVTPRFQSAYARSFRGAPWSGIEDVFTQRIPFIDAAGKQAEEVFGFAGGKTRFQAARRFISGYGTSLVDRFNQLANAPFEFFPILQKVPGLGRFRPGVEPSSGLRTFGKLALKLGIALPAAKLAYDQLDYWVRESSLFDETIFDQGITAAAGTIWTKSQVLLSRTAELTGLHSLRERQEEVAPGSTSLTKLAAFPLMGYLGGSVLGYGERIAKQIALQTQGFSASEASLIYTAREQMFLQQLKGIEPQEQIIRGLSPEMKAIVDREVNILTEGRVGRAAKWIATRQEEKGVLGRLLSVIKKPTFGGMAKWGGLLLGVAAIAPFIPGALVPSTRPDELERIYSGEQEVPVRKGRWWMFGRSPIQGERITRYEQHWYPRMINKAREKAIWGEDEPSPISKWIQENFTYNLEREHYWDRPYPQTSPAFEEVPLIGPLLGATIGRIVKPVRYMHSDEWLREGSGGSEYAPESLRFGERRSLPGLGESGPGAPVGPNDASQVIGEQVYRLRQMVGLPGFAMASFKERLTGTQDLFSQEEQLASAGQIYSPGRAYWEKEIGDPVGFCFVEGTLVYTEQGYMPIETICIGDRVLSQGGVFRSVENTLKKTEYSESIIELEVSTTDSKIRATANHWIPVFKRQRYSQGHVKPIRNSDEIKLKDIQLKDICPGDMVVYPILKPAVFGDYVVDLAPYGRGVITDKFVYRQIKDIEMAKATEFAEFGLNGVCSRKSLKREGFSKRTIKVILTAQKRGYIPDRVDRFVKLSDDLLYFIGWFIAEGFTEDGRISLCMAEKERDIAEHLASILKKELGVDACISKNNGEGIVLRASCSEFARWLSASCGQGAHKKHVPLFVKQMEPSRYVHLLAGVVSGDGWCNKEKSKSGFTSVSKQLIRDVFDLALGLGVIGNLVTSYEESGRGAYPQGTKRKNSLRHYLSWGKKATKQIEAILSRRLPEQTSRLSGKSFIYDGMLFAYVRSAKELEDIRPPVYDLTISDKHYYVVEGTLVHNTEFFRRLYPNEQTKDFYNPLANTQPSWMPGPNDRSENFRQGDPYTLVPRGEERVPGLGYETIHPELKGVSPEDYPVSHRVKILGDLAPYSREYRQALVQARAMDKRGQLTTEDQERISETIKQVAEKKQRKQFSSYLYKEKIYNESELALARENEAAKAEGGPGWMGQLLGSYWETLSHNAETPFEYLTPISPASKLVHARTAVEDYEKTQVWGTQSGYWQHPIRDFVKPFLTSMAHFLGWDGIPSDVQRRREIEEYFDILKYVKFTKLKNEAVAEGDKGEARKYDAQRRETLFGMNPFTKNPATIHRSLPRRERDYFTEFVKADAEEREKILEMIPENEKPLMMARWKMQDVANYTEAQKKGLLTEEEMKKAEIAAEELKQLQETEGFPVNEGLKNEYLSSRTKDETYADWYRRTKLLPEKLEDKPLPGPDWVGFCLPPDQVLMSAPNLEEKMAEEIKIGDKIYDKYGDIRIISDIFKRMINEKIYTIRIAHDELFKMEATGNHLVLAIKTEKCPYDVRPSSICLAREGRWKCSHCENIHFVNYKPEWIAIKDLTTSHYLIKPYLKCSEKNPVVDLLEELPQDLKKLFKKDGDFVRPHSGIIRPVKRIMEIDEQLAWLTGLILADGNVWSTGKRVRGVMITMTIKERPVLELAKKVIEEKFGLVSSVYERYRDTGNSCCLKVNSGFLGTLFETWIGRGCDTKKIPYWITNITRESQQALLGGLLDGDGSKDGRDRLMVTNKALCYLAKLIWEASRQPVSFRCVTRNYNRKTIYSTEPIDKSTRAILGDGFIAYRVEEISSKDYDGEVYDFEVPDGHSYQSFIGVYHNSPLVSLEDLKLKIVENLGESNFDYDIWPDDIKAAAQRPYLEAAAEEVEEGPKLNQQEVRERVLEVLYKHGVKPIDVTILPRFGDKKHSVNLQLKEDRSEEIRGLYRRGELEG